MSPRYVWWVFLIAANAFPMPDRPRNQPKYKPGIVLLSQEHEYIKTQVAHDYWNLSPYYNGQLTGSSCSVATVAIVMNGFRSGMPLSLAEELVHHAGLLEKVGNDEWRRAVEAGGGGIGLPFFAEVMPLALKAFGIGDFSLDVVYMKDESEKNKEIFHTALIENEKSAHDFIIANFDQSVISGDEPLGHYSPIGAYDKENRRVLILDVDRNWVEPYWVPEDLLLHAMAVKEAGKTYHRGYLWVKVKRQV